MEKRDNLYVFLAVLLIVSLGIATYLRQPLALPRSLTGSQIVTPPSVSSSVQVPALTSEIFLDSGLAGGISFQTPSALPASDLNGTRNYVFNPVIGPTFGINQTWYNITIGAGTNFIVDVCVKTSGDLLCTTPATCGAAPPILFTQETYSVGLHDGSAPEINNDLNPATALSSAPLSLAYASPFGVQNIPNLITDQQALFRFWLDIPGGQAPGTYSNSITFQIVQDGTMCV